MPAAFLLLAVIQGLTEFLPISSSGHVGVVARIVGIDGQPVLVAALLHLATAAAGIVYFRRDYWWRFRTLIGPDADRRYACRYVIAQAVTGVVWTPLAISQTGQHLFFYLFSPWLIGAMMLGNAAILLAAHWHDRASEADERNVNPWLTAALIGLAQGLAVIPGLSRSGLTLSAGMMLGMDRREALNFSLMLAPPVMIVSSVALRFPGNPYVWSEVLAPTGDDCLLRSVALWTGKPLRVVGSVMGIGCHHIRHAGAVVRRWRGCAVDCGGSQPGVRSRV